jgi:hypothetical protein
MNEIAQSISPLGFGAAVIGLCLCTAVLMIRFRERNLEQAAEREQAALKRESRSADTQESADDNQVLFKTYTPE